MICAMKLGFLGLGSNLGDRRAYLQAAVEGLWAHDVQVLATSSVYATEPVGDVTDQPEFLNACVEVETRLAVEGLLDACKAVEKALGRTVVGADYVRHGPRPIDVDVLLFDDGTFDSPRLRVPHPELTRRRFVLVPLLEIAPQVEVPGVGPARDALECLPAGQEVRRAGPPLELRS
jgi:2-amino-4-hydroxy-6-hydroxymethyldihydropteridine diphosphokinase